MRIRIPADLPTDPAEAYRRGWRDRTQCGAKAGGKARSASLTPERRSEIARQAVGRRWAKQREIQGIAEAERL